MKRFKRQYVKADSPLILQFRNPSLDSRPMARMWFPDAAAGSRDHDCIKKEIESMAAGGMGGVEIAFLADGCGLKDGKNYGWGTPNWTETLKKIMRAARQVEGGFKVDFTISPHWPPNIFTIDPNDAAASSDLQYAWAKVTREDLEKGSKEVPLPEIKRFDQGGHPFLFRYSFVGASLARVSDMPRPKMYGFKAPPDMTQYDGYEILGALPEGVAAEKEVPATQPMGFGPPPGAEEFVPEGMRREDIDWNSPFQPLPWRSRALITLQHDSLLDVTDRTREKKDAGWRAGVPDEEMLRRWYPEGITPEQVSAAFGPPADEATLRRDGKRDAAFNRKRGADWQSVYETDLAGLALDPASEVETLQPGDLILIGFFYRGTGQQVSGNSPWTIMPNQTYVTNYVVPEGITAITDYWDQHIFSDGELLEMVRANGAEYGGSIFEDSIELQSSGAPWGKGFDRYVPEILGYPIGNNLPILAGFATDNMEETTRIVQDFAACMGKLYIQNHVTPMREWTRSFNYTFRAQAYSLGGLGVLEAALATDVTEGDNSTYDDALRQLQTAVNVKPDEKFLSMESNTFNKFGFSWKSLLRELHYNASQGVNRVIFHGCAFPKNGSGYLDWWPGWNWGEKARANAFMAWDARNVWWEDARRLTDYISRLQTVLQDGGRRVDLAILPSMQMIYEIGEGNSHQALLDRGYSYNLLDENVFRLPNLSMKSGTLFPEGPAYRALVLANCDYLHQETLETVSALAEAGLTVILEGEVPTRVFGVSRSGNCDEGAVSVLADLKRNANVYQVRDDAELIELLKQLNLESGADYVLPGLECSRFEDSVGKYYYFFNGNQAEVTASVHLKGEGAPVRMDCWNGQTEQIPEYTAEGDGVRFVLTVAPGDMALIAVLPCDTGADTALQALPEQIMDGFSLELVSFGPPEEQDPEYDPDYPVTYHKEVLRYERVPNGSSWAKLPASEADLTRLRVRSMADVSGIGIYRCVFTLPQRAVTADLKLAHHAKDVPVTIKVNGADAGTINCMTDILPLEGLVHPGENTLEIRLASTLDNRCYAYDAVQCAALPPEGEAQDFRPVFPVDWTVRYPVGLYTASIVPYTEPER